MASSPIPVRLTAAQLERLQAVADRMGTNRSDIIKLCLLAFLQRFERDGLAMLPTDWDDQLRVLDGRSQRYAPGGVGHRKKKPAKKLPRKNQK